MATNYFLGTAGAVAQSDTVQITAFDGATTYKLTVGGVVISVVGNTDANTTATDLKDAWNLSAHPYTTAVTATVSTDTITLAADTAGVPFIVTSSVSGETGTIGSVTSVTASAGPNHWGTADNWSGGAVPVTGDDTEVKDTNVNICWDLDQSAVSLNTLKIHQSYTGRIGLDYRNFATSADGQTVSTTVKEEYRDIYLKIKLQAPAAGESGTVRIGETAGPARVAGSQRIMLDFDTAQVDAIVYNTATTSADTGRPVVRLLNNNSSSVIEVRNAPGGVGIADEVPGETTTVATIKISDNTTNSRVYVSSGTTYTTYTQDGGVNSIRGAAATVTTVSCNGGTLTTDGDFTITTGNVNGGTFYPNHVKAGGVAFTTINCNGGTTDSTQSRAARTWTTVNLEKGATLIVDGSVVTITTLSASPNVEPYTLVMS